MAEIVHLDADRPDPEVIRQACALLAAGELVGIPTETVCGIPPALARAFGRPIALTSANKSGEADATHAKEAFECLRNDVSLFLDFGPTQMQTPSTILLCTQTETKNLREDAVPAHESGIKQ